MTSASTSTGIICRLPVGYYPARTTYFTAIGNEDSGNAIVTQLYVDTSGYVRTFTGSDGLDNDGSGQHVNFTYELA
jgi:hypothetical protein